MKQHIDGEVLSSLSDEQLKNELRVTALGDRVKLLNRRDKLLATSADEGGTSLGQGATCSEAGALPAQSPLESRLDSSLSELPQPQAAPLALGPFGPSSAPLPATSPNPASVPRQGQRRKPASRPAPAPEPRRPNMSGPVEPSSCPGLPVAGPSKRQAFRCEIFEPSGLQADLGYGGPVDRKACQSSGDPAASAREEVKVRIRKMLDMAFHPRTAEAEGAQALRNAQRLMRTHALAEEEVREATESPEGGLFAAKLTPVNRSHRAQAEKWIGSLASAIDLHFDVAHYLVVRPRQNAVYMVFYGGCTAAELATYAFACAANLIDWMAGGRALPRDRKFTFGEKHRGELFSIVLLEDPDYEQWALNIERSDPNGAAKKLQGFVEYARASRNPAEWDRAYKEGMADALFKKAEDAHKQEDAASTSQALATSLEAMRKQVLEHFGIRLGSIDMVMSRGLRNARSSGSSDAAAVTLGQGQIQRDSPLAITG